MTSIVSCVCWVPKGVSKETPDKVHLAPEEIEKLLKDARKQLKDLDSKADDVSEEGDPRASESNHLDGTGNGDAPVPIEELYDMEHYDSDEGGMEGQKVSGAGMGNSLAGLTYYPSNEEDPYITLKNVLPEDDESDDFRILPVDNLLVVGKAEKEFSSVEVHVYSESDDHSYCHHEILLTSFPLALEWMDFDPEQPDKKGSYLAVGMMSPGIEVWDLDVVDGLEPVFTLRGGGHAYKVQGKGKKKKKKSGASPDTGSSEQDGHTDAILDLSWNRVVRSVLASASADCSVRIWDMTLAKCVLTLPQPDKVQCVQWHPYEPQLLVTGGYNRMVQLYDCKSPENVLRSWKLDGEVEKVLWNHFKPELLLASTEGKTVWCLHKDSGNTVFQIHAHSEAITDISLSCHVPGLLVTGSTDDTIKFWDIQDNAPVFLLNRDMHMTSVLCARFCVDSPYTLVVGGQRNGFHMFNVALLPAVMQRFKDRGLMVAVTEGQSSPAAVTQDGDEDEKSGSEMEVDEQAAGGSELPSDLQSEGHQFNELGSGKVHVKSKKTTSKLKGKKRKH